MFTSWICYSHSCLLFSFQYVIWCPQSSWVSPSSLSANFSIQKQGWHIWDHQTGFLKSGYPKLVFPKDRITNIPILDGFGIPPPKKGTTHMMLLAIAWFWAGPRTLVAPIFNAKTQWCHRWLTHHQLGQSTTNFSRSQFWSFWCVRFNSWLHT
jgi:hypothetical protein